MSNTGTGHFTDEKISVVQSGSKLVQRCLLMATDPGDLVLDPTCGSGTSATVAEQGGRRWLTIGLRHRPARRPGRRRARRATAASTC